MLQADFDSDNLVTMPEHLPPQAIEAEEAVLGGILFDPQAITRVLRILQPDDFYVTAHKNIYQASVQLHQLQQPTDLLFLTNWLESHGMLHVIGGRNKLVTLVDRCVSAINVDALAQLIKEKAKLRKLITIANQIAQSAYSAKFGEMAASDVIEIAQQKLTALRQSTQENQIKSMALIVPEVYAEIEASNSGEDAIEVSLPTGFYDLDNTIGGMQFGALTVIGGRGGIGKSTIALDIALRVAKSGLTTVYFALEMTSSQMVKKTLSRLAAPDVPAELLFKSNALKESHWNPLAQACAEAIGLPFWLNDNPVMTTSQIRGDLQDVEARCGQISLVVVDYVRMALRKAETLAV
ncbi:MAG: replicative DNA helicase [Desmonostoc vinosum HA7617-LM4]|jgi:replicative DNA helicase|nr:replicative DNA helicase [Desmonostoc vinosum HA7617-LM4]